jgi:orotidine-5'-phosphate decarboxylase
VDGVTAADRLCLALDTGDLASAVRWVERTRDAFRVFKVGLELFGAHGPAAVTAVRDAGARAVFLDLKLHDIPQTVARAVDALLRAGVDYLTVHAGGGRAMLEAAAAAARGEVCVLGVTVLTSLDATALAEVGVPGPLDAVVAARARLARAAGLGGIVCSAVEARTLRAEVGPDLRIVTPGIRPAGLDAGDQRRVATPRSALDAGADLLVVGRPVTAAADWQAAVSALHAEMA